MLGLGHYESSDDDEDAPKASSPKLKDSKDVTFPRDEASVIEGEATVAQRADQPPHQPAATVDSPATGPTEGPTVGPAEQPPQLPSPPNGTTSRPSSPYSSNRALIRSLTLPPIPNLDIPPSPPGSPSPSANQKFAHFLSLKSQGVHFNEKLAASSSLKNPALLSKLMEHAGIDTQDQYATTLPNEVWDVNPSRFPSSAYWEEMRKNQEEIRKRNEREEQEKRAAGRGTIDFVSGGNSGDSSRSGTPTGGKPRNSAAERVMAGLNREKPRSPLVSDLGKRKR